jgi:hypothetical protein
MQSANGPARGRCGVMRVDRAILTELSAAGFNRCSEAQGGTIDD